MFNESIEGPLQSFTVQWDVAGDVDGDVIADGLVAEGGVIVRGQQDEEGVFHIAQPVTAGIYDLDALGKDGAYGERYLRWIFIESDFGVIPPAFSIAVVFRHPVSGAYIQLQVITAGFVFGVSTTFYLSEMIHIPQGAALQITGLGGPLPGGTDTVKISVQAGTSALEDAQLHRAMCCDGSVSSGGDTPSAGVSLDFYSFSSREIEVGAGEDGTYFRFSANRLDGADDFNESESLLNEAEGVVGQSAEKLAIRAGAVTRLALRASAPIIYRWFVEVAAGGGGFVRTFAMPAAIALVANTTTIIDAAPSVPFPVGARVRSGLLITTNATLTTILVELEIATPL